MPLLFLLAGASTYFALKHRGIGQYVVERSKRLLVPLVFGIFVLVPPQTWYGARTNDGYLGSYLEYLTSGAFLNPDNLVGRGDYYGGLSPAHLWFIMFLWLLSMVSVPLLAWGRTERGAATYTRLAQRIANPFWWPIVVFAVLVGDALPDIGGKNPFYFLVFFVLGYLIMHAHEAFATMAERGMWPALIIGASITILTLAFWQLGEGLPDPSPARALWSYVELMGGWLMVVGFMGVGRRYLDKPSARLSYLGEASYPVYILHQTVIVMLGFYLVMVIPQPWIGWPLLIAISAVVTFALYEGVRRVGALRFLFGMRPIR